MSLSFSLEWLWPLDRLDLGWRWLYRFIRLWRCLVAMLLEYIGMYLRNHLNFRGVTFLLGKILILLLTFILNNNLRYLDEITFLYQGTVAGASGANFEAFLASRAAEARQFTERAILGNIQTVGLAPAATQVAYPTPGA
jgi:hypothetical protein